MACTFVVCCGWHCVCMARRFSMHGEPRSYLKSGGVWPEGPFRKDTPVAVFYGAEISRRLASHISDTGLSKVAVAQRIGIARGTLYDVLTGVSLPDIHTVINAEQSLEISLWPNSVHR